MDNINTQLHPNINPEEIKVVVLPKGFSLNNDLDLFNNCTSA